MKKDLIFAPILFIICSALFLLEFTGITVHIVASIVGILALAVYTVQTKKEWKIPALEIAMRACYGVALISGIVIMRVQGILALGILHKVAATAFLALLIAVLLHKAICEKKAGK